MARSQAAANFACSGVEDRARTQGPAWSAVGELLLLEGASLADLAAVNLAGPAWKKGKGNRLVFFVPTPPLALATMGVDPPF